METVVISIGGSVILPDLDTARIKKFADMLVSLRKKKIKAYVVVGGGKGARDYIQVARNLGANDAECDEVGIAFTRLNARLLIAALGDNAQREPALSLEEAGRIRDGRVIVMGGTHIGHTTDAVAALLAEYLRSDLLIIATNVDGVYSEDPKKNPKAKKFSKISASELVKIVMSNVMKAGSAGVVDPLAAKIIERSGIKTIVVNGNNPAEIESACSGSHDGTVIN